MVSKILSIAKIEDKNHIEKLEKILTTENVNFESLEELLLVIDRVKLAPASFIAAILDFIYKTPSPEFLEKIKAEFGEEIYEIYFALGQLEKYQTENLNQAENFRMMLVAISKDIRVLVIKLCVILFTIRHFKRPITDKEKTYLIQVKEIFAPLGERLGINFIKSEIEDYCLRFLEPDVYDFLEASVQLKRGENQRQIATTKEKLEQILKDLNINGQITYRQKHFSSVHKKMTANNITLAQIYDLIAMRVIVDSVEDCYAVIGGIHGVYKPMAGRIKDYIATPKPNGYQSLHTTIIAENKRPLEIQIRTVEMHRISEYGIAAHWIYKEKRVKKSVLDEKLGWIRAIMENTEGLTSKELIDTFKKQLNAGVIYVQTPKGKILEFPEESTLIDFAYAIHSDVGNTCVGGKINGKIRPLTSMLSNGDVVEIITSPNSKGPSRDWLNIVVTATAKNKIKYFFRNAFKEEHIKTGKKMLEEELKARGMEVSKFTSGKIFDTVKEKLCYAEDNELFASIGYGSLSVKQVVNRIVTEEQKLAPQDKTLNFAAPKLMLKKNKDGVLIDGDSGMLVRYANCCSPVLGDEIVGYISRGKGVTIHRAGCHNVKFLEPERLILAEWMEKQGQLFAASLKIISAVSNQFAQNVMRQIMEQKLFIISFNTKINNKNNMVTTVKLQVESQDKLSQLIKLIENFKETYEVLRTND